MTLSTSTPEVIYPAADRDYPLPRTERRKFRRFPLRQSATLRCKSTLTEEMPAFTVNASVTSVLVTAEAALAEGRAVQVAISLKKDGMETVRLYGTGTIVRSEILPTGRSALAIAFEKPLASAPTWAPRESTVNS